MASVTANISDYTLDGATLNFVARVNSNADALDTIEATFGFTVTLEAPQCGTWVIGAPVIASQIEWYYGDPPLQVPFTGASNGSCGY